MSKIRIYRAGETQEIAAIDWTPAWQAQGWGTTPQRVGLVEDAPPPAPPDSPALSLINAAMVASELVVLPSIGEVRAAAILENRPAGGYKSLEQVAQLNPHGPDWDAVSLWAN